VETRAGLDFSTNKPSGSIGVARTFHICGSHLLMLNGLTRAAFTDMAHGVRIGRVIGRRRSTVPRPGMKYLAKLLFKESQHLIG
jgi:hypothetical protein